jgi:hypothetical protein
MIETRLLVMIFTSSEEDTSSQEYMPSQVLLDSQGSQNYLLCKTLRKTITITNTSTTLWIIKNFRGLKMMMMKIRNRYETQLSSHNHFKSPYDGVAKKNLPWCIKQKKEKSYWNFKGTHDIGGGLTKTSSALVFTKQCIDVIW